MNTLRMDHQLSYFTKDEIQKQTLKPVNGQSSMSSGCGCENCSCGKKADPS